MSDEKSSGKWAAEVYDFLRIFGRINSTVYGLLLVEVGWVLLLILITQLTPSGGNTPPMAFITLPWPHYQEYRVIDLYLPGAIGWVLAWALWSGIPFYLWFIIRSISLRFLFWLFVGLGVLASLVNVLLLWLTWPIEFIKAQKFIKDLNPEKKAELLQKETANIKGFLKKHVAGSEGDVAKVALRIGWRNAFLFFKDDNSERKIAKLEKGIETFILYKIAIKSTDFTRWIIHIRSWKILVKVLQIISTQTYIGFAPIHSYNYEEDRMADKASAQAFSSAIDYMRMKLAQIDLMKFLHFDILPDHFIPSNISSASFLRKICRFDVLLWGSYINGQPNKIWFNIDQAIKKPDSKKKNGKESDPEESRNDYSIFPLTLDINYSRMIVDQTIFLDTYAALIIAIIQLKARVIGSENKGVWARLIDTLRYRFWDMEMVTKHLVLDVFPKLNLEKRSESSEEDFPTIPKIIVEIVGRWIGYSISMAITYIDLDRIEFIKNNKVVLLEYMKACISAFPEIPQNYYRAGFFACLLGKPKDAIGYFETARQYEHGGIGKKDASTIYELIIARLFRNSFKRREDEFLLAGYAALVARAVNLGDALDDIAEERNEYQKIRNDNDFFALDMHTTVVLDKLFSNEYELGH